MARKAEATLWMLAKIEERAVMKRVVKKGRSYVPKVEGPKVHMNQALTITATRRMAAGPGNRWATTLRLPSRSRRRVSER